MQMTQHRIGFIAVALGLLWTSVGCSPAEQAEVPTSPQAAPSVTASPETNVTASIPSSETTATPEASATGSGEETASSTASPTPSGMEPPATDSGGVPATTGGSSPNPTAPSSNGLTERYVVKVRPSVLAPAEFTLILNDEEIGSFSTQASQDITGFVKPGKNKVAIRYAALQKITNSFGETVLTIGVERDGKWATAVNQVVRKADPKGEKTFRFIAR